MCDLNLDLTLKTASSRMILTASLTKLSCFFLHGKLANELEDSFDESVSKMGVLCSGGLLSSTSMSTWICSPLRGSSSWLKDPFQTTRSLAGMASSSVDWLIVLDYRPRFPLYAKSLYQGHECAIAPSTVPASTLRRSNPNFDIVDN